MAGVFVSGNLWYTKAPYKYRGLCFIHYGVCVLLIDFAAIVFYH